MLPEFLWPVAYNSRENSSRAEQLLSVVGVLTVARTQTTGKTFLGKAQHHGTMNICFGYGRNLSLISGCFIHGLGMQFRLHIVLTEFLQTKQTDFKYNNITGLTQCKHWLKRVLLRDLYKVSLKLNNLFHSWHSLQLSFSPMFRLFVHAEN